MIETGLAQQSQEQQLPECMVQQDQYKLMLRQKPEVQQLTNLININDSNTVVIFGAQPSQELSKISDQLLHSMKGTSNTQASEMLAQLTKIMDKFDIQEIKDPEKSVRGLNRFFGKAKDALQKLFEKYDDMGKEVDKIYVILNGYKNDIMKSNEVLDRMLEANMQYYQELEQYIVAGELGLEEIEDYRSMVMSRVDISEEQKAQESAKIDLLKNMLSQRVYDLRVSENVAMQTAPMIQTMKFNNFNLMMSIQNAFITTLPIFKNCLISAIQLKQQAIQSQSISHLNDKTNELLLRNAQNNARQSVAIAAQANSSGVKIETLQQSFDTIKKGIEDTKAITAKMAEDRVKNTDVLEKMKGEMRRNGWV